MEDDDWRWFLGVPCQSEPFRTVESGVRQTTHQSQKSQGVASSVGPRVVGVFFEIPVLRTRHWVGRDRLWGPIVSRTYCRGVPLTEQVQCVVESRTSIGSAEGVPGVERGVRGDPKGRSQGRQERRPLPPLRDVPVS